MIFNLFKSELNFKEHPDILNYLIVEEAEQQWNYHFKEGLAKEAFRSPQFSSSVVNLFVKTVLKMRIDEKLLLLIADFGFRRAKERGETDTKSISYKKKNTSTKEYNSYEITKQTVQE